MSQQDEMTIANLVTKMQHGWDDLNAYLDGLTDAQRTGKTDAAGWTVKDHVIHLAVWEDGIDALLNKQNRHERMGLDDETFFSGDYDRMNAIIQQAHKDMTWVQVMADFTAIHNRLIVRIQSMRDADLMKPYADYQPGGPTDRPVVGWIVGNTFEHYEEHRPWMEAIAES